MPQPDRATIVFDPATGRILAADDAACASLGRSREELLGLEITLRPPPAAEQGGTDPLTGLADRTTFSRRLAAALAEAAARPDYRFAVLFLDLDGFKAVNDRLGHLGGDRVLAEIAGRLARAVRPDDLVARFGGDEFTVFLDRVSHEADALAAARRLQARVDEPLPGAEPNSVSASVGVAVSWDGYRAPEAMLEAADQAMYRAKRGLDR